MFSCNRHETRTIIEGKATGVVRKYDPSTGCPHKTGAEIVLTSSHMAGFEGQQVPFAKATVMSVRPGTVDQFKKDNRIGMMDGFANGISWHGHFSNIVYPGIRDSEKVHHIQFRITDMEENPKAG